MQIYYQIAHSIRSNIKQIRMFNTHLEERPSSENPAPEKQLVTYCAPWLVFSLAFSTHPRYPYRLAVGSFVQQEKNQVEIVQLSTENSQKFDKKVSFQHPYPPNKIMWIPDLQGAHSDLLATSGESLNLWEITDNKDAKLKAKLECQNQFCAPLTSLDWNPVQLQIIVTSSIDTTCAVWDIQKQVNTYQLLAHDKEAYDVHFSKEKNIFASVGADGSVRQFDLRQFEHSSVLYENKDVPLMKLAWNRIDGNYLAVLEMDQPHVLLLDRRKPSIPMGHLKNHKESVNAIAWSPQSNLHICTVGDDQQAFVWDLKDFKQTNYFPLLQYNPKEPISNLIWSVSQPQWVSICFDNCLQIIPFS